MSVAPYGPERRLFFGRLRHKLDRLHKLTSLTLAVEHIQVSSRKHLAGRDGSGTSVVQLWLTAAEERGAVSEGEDVKTCVLITVPQFFMNCGECDGHDDLHPYLNQYAT